MAVMPVMAVMAVMVNAVMVHGHQQPNTP